MENMQTKALCFLFSLILSSSVLAQEPSFQKKHLKEQGLLYTIFFREDSVGQQKLDYTYEGKNLIIHELTSVPGFLVEDIYCTLDKKTVRLKEFSASGTMTTSQGDKEVDIQWKFENDSVKGYSYFPKLEGKEPVRAQLPLETGNLERTSFFYTLHALNWEWKTGSKIEVYQFDSIEGKNRKVTIAIEGEEKVSVPAGTFDTYKVKFTGGAASQNFYVAKGKNKRIVKITFNGLPWVYELINGV